MKCLDQLPLETHLRGSEIEDKWNFIIFKMQNLYLTLLVNYLNQNLG